MAERLAYGAMDERVSLDLTPLIDIVFILLIFFLVTASFTKLNGVAVERPESSTNDLRSPQALVVSLDADGVIWLDRKPVALNQVRQRVAAAISGQGMDAAVINADRRVASGPLLELIDQVRLGGVAHVAVATEQR